MKKYFGGSHLIGKRKAKRPLNNQDITHFILRLKENLPAFFSPKDEALRELFCTVANKHEVHIQQLVFNHTHLHAALLIKDRECYNAFARELTSKIVAHLSKVIGVKLKDIFAHRPFTRIVSGPRGLMTLENYLMKNERESRVKQTHRFPGFFGIVTEGLQESKSAKIQNYGAKPARSRISHSELEGRITIKPRQLEFF
jgi:REP element-mobilizing transposase RayT